MVSTRGHRDNDDESNSKSNLPQRECRKPKTTLQEPEDEMFWESDEPMTHGRRKRRSAVTFGENTEYIRENMRSKRNSTDSKMKLSESGEESEKETSRLMSKSEEDTAEHDTDSDDELFRHRKSTGARHCLRNARASRRIGSTLRSTVKKEFPMNGDDEMSDHEGGLRRSSRQRKLISFTDNQSWLFNTHKRLKGYPNMILCSEPENDEPRAARKPKRYVMPSEKSPTSSAPQRRSQRFRKKSPEQRSLRSRNRNYLLRKHESRSLLTRPRRRPMRYRDSQSEEGEEEDEIEEEEEEEEEDEREKSEEIERGGAKRKVQATKKAGREGDTENSEDEEEVVFKSRGRGRRRGFRGRASKKVFRESRDASSESEEEEEGDEEEEKKEEVNGEEAETTKDTSMELGKPKRQRKPVTRYTIEHKQRPRTKVCSSDESKDSDDDEDTEEGEEEGRGEKKTTQRGGYSLRQNRKTSLKTLEDPSSRRLRKLRETSPKNLFSSPARKQKIFNKKYRATHNTAISSTSSSSDEKEFEKRFSKSMTKARNRCLPMNFAPEDFSMSSVKERSKIGSSLADIDPMHVDKSVSFESIGGLSQHIRSLKEMIMFPLMYPEVFHRFSINPPRGVLFYGPPGTGKTLVARALSVECSEKDKKVAFFMRKGADCLSKWVGESERQLRLLFDQAYQMRPSIIFFDEIDGLAPVRSTRQDQIHSSIVSTLLALMDGLDSRGEVVVIGATNRVDAIDPALRRPGRFDREFCFPLPNVTARKQIIDIHTRNWSPKPSKRLVYYLAEQTVGYCGADLKALCAEATLNALRTKFPQIYISKHKLLLDVTKIHIKFCHFRQALSKIVPAGQRAISGSSRKLSKVIQPLLQPLLTMALTNLRHSFTPGFSKLLKNRVVHRPKLLICGTKGQGGTTHLAPAILHAMEKVPMHKLDMPALFSVSARAPEEACAQIFHEARRNLPSILYIPLIDQWWNTVSDTVKATFFSLLNELDPSTPLLLLATSETLYSQMDEEFQRLFSAYRDELLVMSNPKEDSRRAFFRPLFFTKMTQKPKPSQRKKRVLETLPPAPPPQPRKLSPNELQKITEVEEATLRELRIFLRQICAKLAKNRMFYIFTKPVDLDEVPDYMEVITTPMDLETMMTKIDHYKYECAEDFLKDIDQICANALEYNPDRNPEDKLIRHRACTLRDTAYAYIKAEMDTDFEMKCRDIRKARVYRQQSPAELVPHFIKVGPPVTKMAVEASADKAPKPHAGASTPLNQSQSQNSTNELSFKNKSVGEISRKRKRRKSSWARGFLATKKKKCTEKEEEKKEAEKEEEEETNEAEAKRRVSNDEEDEEEEEASLHSSSLKYDDDTELTEEQITTDNSQSKVTLNPSNLCNGGLSTEDSRDSMKVTSAADLLYSKSLKESFQKSGISTPVNSGGLKSLSSQLEAEESVVSSSEPGCSERATEVLIDWAHLDAIYESCVAMTEGVVLDDIHYLYTTLVGLTEKYSHTLDRTPLLNVVEIELRKFAQFREKP